ncbi:MAG: cytidine deaminase [Synergistaceae bacterium]|nr:cytidine deaminase [Synergistaceae bacterium]
MNGRTENRPSSQVDAEALLEAAREGRCRAYAPYSGFRVGAAVLTADGRVHVGCNVENASFGLTVCAERIALFSALSAGAGKPLAVGVAGKDGIPCFPCGACLQVMAEFNPELAIVLDQGGRPVVYGLAELLPLRFELERDPDES